MCTSKGKPYENTQKKLQENNACMKTHNTPVQENNVKTQENSIGKRKKKRRTHICKHLYSDNGQHIYKQYDGSV